MGHIWIFESIIFIFLCFAQQSNLYYQIVLLIFTSGFVKSQFFSVLVLQIFKHCDIITCGRSKLERFILFAKGYCIV